MNMKTKGRAGRACGGLRSCFAGDERGREVGQDESCVREAHDKLT